MDKNKTLNKNKQDNIWDAAYLILYALTVAHAFYFTTMFPTEFLDNTARYFYGAILLYVVLKLVFSKRYSRAEQVLSVVMIGIFSIAGVVTGYLEIIQFVLLIVGAKGIDFRKILMSYSAAAVLMLLAAFVASQCGIIVDLITYTPRSFNGGLRHSFGIIYPTDFAAHVFYVVMAIACVVAIKRGRSENKKKNAMITIAICVISIVIAGFLYYECLAFTSTICLIGFVMLVVFMSLISHAGEKIYKFFVRVLMLAPVLLSVLYISLSKFYVAGVNIWEKINTALSNRIAVSSRALSMYNVKLFGQFIEELGWGGLSDTSNISEEQYFFIDDSYLRILLEYGLFVFIIVIAIFTIILKKSADKRQIILFAALVAVAVHCFMEHHMMEVAYNPFLLIFLTVMPEGEKNELEEVDNPVH